MVVIEDGLTIFPSFSYISRHSLSNLRRLTIDWQPHLSSELDLLSKDTRDGIKKRDAPSIEKVSKVFNIGRRVMLENGNISVDDDGIEHYPLFVAAFMKDLEPEWDGPEF